MMNTLFQRRLTCPSGSGDAAVAKILLLAALLLAGCGAGPRPMSNVAYYDLGTLPPGTGNRTVGYLRSMEVFAPSWLDSSAMQFRLHHAGNQRRQNYAESRWVAPPAELIGHALRKRMLSGEAGGACRLRIDLDEFAQVFDSAKDSRAVLEARAQIVAPTGGEILARRSFSLSRPAGSADAGGGVKALAGAVEILSTELHGWLGGLDRAAASGLNIAQRCRS